MTANGEPALRPVTVTGALAVSVAVPVPVAPTATLPKSTGCPFSAVCAGRPKAITLPSRVPT